MVKALVQVTAGNLLKNDWMTPRTQSDLALTSELAPELLAGEPRWQGRLMGVRPWGFAIASTLTLLGVSALMTAPTLAEEPAPADPVSTSAESLLRPQAPSPESVPAPTVVPSTPAPAAPTPSPAPAAAPGGNNSPVIDPTDYGLGATPATERPNLVFSERRSGCRLTVGQGGLDRTCTTATSGGNTGAAGVGSEAQAAGGNVRVGPVIVGTDGVSVGNTTIISREALNERLRPLNVIRRGIEEFVFPLATPAPISSLFGWRTHPIFGDRRFHAGTDIAAPTGTPVLAAKAGTVSTADYLGGYGLTVILRHDDGSQETRYAHLSQLMVRPGESVQQGDVIGLVGSTGNSTGPHLHFELRQLTAQGWVLIDPNELLAYTQINLVETLNRPLSALNTLMGGDSEASDPIDWEAIPYRPAQPNAS